MEVCTGGYGSNSHEEICYNGRSCPLCSVIEELEETSKQLDQIRRDLDDAIDQRDEYKDLLDTFAPEALV